MSSADSNWEQIAEAVASATLARHADDVDQRARWPAEGMQALAETGLLGLTVPTDFGGAAQGPGVFAGVTRILAERCASTAMIYLMHVCATQVLVAAREFGQRETVLKSIAAGRHLSTLAFSEKGSRSHFWQPISQAVVAGDARRLTAEKSFATSAGHADSYIVSTRSAGRTEPIATTLYYVPRNATGFSVRGPWTGMGLRGNASAPMQLENVTALDSDRVSAEGDGFATMMQVVLPWFQLGSAAVSVGIMRSATAATRQHLLNSRFEHLGQPLAALPNLRIRLAQMQITVDAQQAFLDHVAGLLERPGPATMLGVLESKAAAAAAALQVTDLAMQTCGGAAFSRQLPIERNLRDARAAWVMAPTTDALHDFIGKALLDMPLF
jgi:alkylation response protein AidB-like acyl-CoA dehydrogenase